VKYGASSYIVQLEVDEVDGWMYLTHEVGSTTWEVQQRVCGMYLILAEVAVLKTLLQQRAICTRCPSALARGKSNVQHPTAAGSDFNKPLSNCLNSMDYNKCCKLTASCCCCTSSAALNASLR
jgi:hypothetical protein